MKISRGKLIVIKQFLLFCNQSECNGMEAETVNVILCVAIKTSSS